MHSVAREIPCFLSRNWASTALAKLARQPWRKRQRISPIALPGQRPPRNPVAAQNFGLDSTARSLQKARQHMASPRRLRTALLGLSAALWASPGLAQTTTTTSVTTATSTTTSLATSDFTITLEDKDNNQLSAADAATYLNQARCQCATPMNIQVQMASASTSKLSSNTTAGTSARLYVGLNCATLNANQQPTCGVPLATYGGNISGLATGAWIAPTNAQQLFGGIANCTSDGSTTIYLWLDSTGQGQPDSTVSDTSAPSLGVSLVGKPPPAPTGVTVQGGEEALVVSWTSISTTTTTDLAGYLVFCMRGDGLQVFNPSSYDSSSSTSGQYYTSQILASESLCPASPTGISPSLTTSLSSSAAGDTTTAGRATEVVAPAAFQELDPNYLCTGLLPPTQTSVRVGILQNGIPYQVGVAAVNNAGNASPIQSGFIQTPVPTMDFYTKYRADGGKATGGCSMAGRGTRFGTISFLAASGLLTLIIVRRRRIRRALLRGLPCLLLVLAAGPAQAQVSVSHEESSEKPSDEPGSYQTPKEWALELRFGPYRPNVDSEFGGSANPYSTVFGGKRHLMSGMELDWQILQEFGSLAAGFAFGYYTVNAKAFVLNPSTHQCVPDPTTASGCQISGDTTSLRLVPISLLAVYRWDVAAERWKIPLVPYAKLGLNYTFWRVTDGNGNVPYPPEGGRGSGGTAGWQGALGASFLLDFIDPDAARNLDMETNINHSYLFFEWNWMEATGLGMSNKLHVGDNRWVLGLMFEF